MPRYWGYVASFWSHNNSRTILLAVLLVCSCARPVAQPYFRGVGEKARTILVVSHGWHSGIVIKKADIPENALPEVKDFPDADYLEVGWGEWDYYQAPDPGLGLALKAAFWPDRSVLRVAGFKGAAENYFRGSEIVEIVLSDEAFQRVIQFISDTFPRSDPAAPVEARPGLSPDSRFYAAKGKFHIFRTCNTWVAEALKFAGLPVNPTSVLTAGNLISQVRQLPAPN